MIRLPRTLAVRQEQLTQKQHLILCTGGIISQIVSAACPLAILLSSWLAKRICEISWHLANFAEVLCFVELPVLVTTHTYLDKLHSEIWQQFIS
jgi:hypothetical protein